MSHDLIIHDEVSDIPIEQFSTFPKRKTLADLKQAAITGIINERMVRTHDSHGISYQFGNRGVRRQSMRTDRGNPKKPKQYHKQGH